MKLAADIVEQGLDPLALIAVVPTPDQKKRYTVVEGNRRVVALKILETPSLVTSVFNARDQKRLISLANKFAANPITTLQGVLFQTEQEGSLPGQKAGRPVYDMI